MQWPVKRTVYRSKPTWPPPGVPARGTPRVTYAQGPEDELAARHIQPWVETGDLERVAARVKGVLSCRVYRRGDEPVPERVRLTCQAGRRTAVAKDIQSAWFALYDLYVPRRLFTVTAVRSRLDLLPERRRPQLCQVAFERAGERASARVTLWAGGRGLEGRATSAAATADPRSLAARATLAAVAGLLRHQPELLELRRLRLAGMPTVVCVLSGPRGQPLMGCCQIRGDEGEATARAVLDAVNRVLARRPLPAVE